MVDDGEADDKIIAVLENDAIWGQANSLTDLPESLIERLRHYFLTYKLNPKNPTPIQIDTIFGVEHAHKVINAAIEDYQEMFDTLT